jgi:Leucine-rich repeat (LRR) protein
LKKLSLRNNKLHTITKDLFSELTSLLILDLGGNKITSIEPGAFNKLGLLESLDLSVNRLNTINNNLFIGLDLLQELILFNNWINFIPTGTFTRFKALTYLDLTLSPVTEIEPRAFSDSFDYKNLRILLFPPFLCCSRDHYQDSFTYYDSTCSHEGEYEFFLSFPMSKCTTTPSVFQIKQK